MQWPEMGKNRRMYSLCKQNSIRTRVLTLYGRVIGTGLAWVRHLIPAPKTLFTNNDKLIHVAASNHLIERKKMLHPQIWCTQSSEAAQQY